MSQRPIPTSSPTASARTIDRTSTTPAHRPAAAAGIGVARPSDRHEDTGQDQDKDKDKDKDKADAALTSSCDSQEDSPGSESAAALRQRCAAQARRIEELERDFHALSHSIRSPLVALKGFAGLLDEEMGSRLGENGQHFLGRISEAGRRIEMRLNDLAALLAVYEEKSSRAWIDPRAVIEKLAGEFEAPLDEAGMCIKVQRELPPVFCDRAKLEIALRHLIGNTIQHGVPASPPDIHIRVERDDAETRVTVADSGPGMDSALLERAFEPFDCAGDRTRRFDRGRESSGIGLALVRRIAESHGGEARIESAPDRGTNVVMTFPHE